MWCPPPKLSHFSPGSRSAELLLHRVQRHGQRVGVLLTEGVEVQAVQQSGEARLLCQRGVPLGAGGAETAARGAGVIDGMALLRGALRVDAQTDALARRLCRRAELCQLGRGVEHDVVGVMQQLVELVHPVGGAEDVVLLLGQLFPAQTALVEAAGLSACQIGCEKRVEVEVGESLLRQQDLAARPLLDPQQNFAVAAQLGFVQQIAGGGQAKRAAPSERFASPAKGGRRIDAPASVHQSRAVALRAGQAVLVQCVQIRVRDRTLRQCGRPWWSTCRSAASGRRTWPARRWCS